MSTRLLLDNDGSNFLGSLGENHEHVVAQMVDDCPSEVDTYLLCPGAGTYYFPTKVGDRYYPNLEPIYASGADPIRNMLEGLKARGIEAFLTFRTNDVHNANEPDHPLVPSFRKRNPEFVVDAEAVRAGKGGWQAYCLDYSRPEVREYYLAIIEELIALYDVDGMQLDWMRFTRHLSGTPDEVWDRRGFITEFTRQVRGMLGAGRQLMARIPTTPQACRDMGLDVSAWAREGLVDSIVACPFLTTDFTMPIAELREMAGNGAVPVYGGVDFNHSGQAHCPESLRATALSLLDCGADGIYLFNFPCWTEHLAATPYHWLKGFPDCAVEKPLLFSVSSTLHRIGGVDQPGVLPISLAAGEQGDAPLHVPASALPARKCLVLVHADAEVSVSLNGEKLTRRREPARPEIFVEHRDGSINEGVVPQVFEASPDDLRSGANEFTLQAGKAAAKVTRVNVGLW